MHRVWRLRTGALAGLLAGLSLGLTEAALRFAGVPLPSELVADRVLPLVPVDQFLVLLQRAGGPVAAKQQALVGGFVTLPVLGAALGALFAELRLRFSGIDRHPGAALAVLVGFVWVACLAMLGPVLQAHNLGLPPVAAGVVTAVALLLQFGIFARVLWGMLRHRPLGPVSARAQPGRRVVLMGGAGLAVAAATGVLGNILYRGSTLAYDGLNYLGPGVRITPNDQFYLVTKNIIDPTPLPELWKLEVGGLVKRPSTMELADLISLPGAVDREYTLECISNEIGRGLISNAVWRGVTLRSLLESAQVLPGAVGVSLRAVDGYTNTISLATALDDAALVAYRMNGEQLPERHGYPARLLVPSAYGEVSVKWLTAIDVVDNHQPGYYESQGWRPSHVRTTSRIDSPRGGPPLRAGEPAVIRGIAYAAERGISAVEVSTDGGASWSAAVIESGQKHSWTLWSFPWRPPAGRRVLAVRAYDGTGDLQGTMHLGSVPAGAGGIHRVSVIVAA